MIDIHCHILAEVDDGPRSFEDSTEMCRLAAADGIEHIVATPHANERYHYDRDYLDGLLVHLRKSVGPVPRLTLGCDLHFSYDNFLAVMALPQRYTIEGGRYLLVELNNYSIPVQVDECFTQLRTKGVHPIITHPERNPILQQNPLRVLQWIDLGCAVQVTGSALTGGWGERAWHAAQWLLKRNAVHIIASDAHDLVRRRPGLSSAREAAAEVCGEDVAHALVDANPRAVVDGQSLPYFPAPLAKI
ncbi:MAG: exopolysaccharide biosynthesis protein [Acidobacteriales bacterium]|nr:exopolysaccharide biosynthesis protein [Terriglobales bacterium]